MCVCVCVCVCHVCVCAMYVCVPCKVRLMARIFCFLLQPLCCGVATVCLWFQIMLRTFFSCISYDITLPSLFLQCFLRYMECQRSVAVRRSPALAWHGFRATGHLCNWVCLHSLCVCKFNFQLLIKYAFFIHL